VNGNKINRRSLCEPAKLEPLARGEDRKFLDRTQENIKNIKRVDVKNTQPAVSTDDVRMIRSWKHSECQI
jgi:hypothetical protein